MVIVLAGFTFTSKKLFQLVSITHNKLFGIIVIVLLYYDVYGWN